MNEDSWPESPKIKFRRLRKQIICIVVDTAFLCFWVVIQYLAKLLIERLGLSGIDRWVLLTFQVVFAVSTITPVIIYIYKDIKVMLIRMTRQIKQEIIYNEIADEYNER
jgi:hypothetical protein